MSVPLAQLDPNERWETLLDDEFGVEHLADDVSPATLAEQFGSAPSRVEQLCSDAFTEAVSEGAVEIRFAHFEAAAGDDNTIGESVEQFDANEESDDGGTVEQFDESESTSAEESVEQFDETSSAEETATPDEAPDTDVTTDSGDLADRVAALEADNEALRSEVQELAGLVEALRKQIKIQSRLLVGEEHVSTAVDPTDTGVDDILTRLSELDDRVEEHDQQVAMVRTDGSAGADDPDSRARFLRQTLYNQAKGNDGRATMDRDAADSRLGGGLHRDTVLDAMRRAADGYEAEISGASDLQPVDSITFKVGEGRGTQSRIVMDLSNATGSEIRRNLTTKTTEDGGNRGR